MATGLYEKAQAYVFIFASIIAVTAIKRQKLTFFILMPC
jgi:hypothetical protein